MIYYEVNVELDNEIYNEYMTWLTNHVQTILNFDGFVEARILRVSQQQDGSKQDNPKQTVVIVYELISEEALNDYLVNEAPAMRQATLHRFGNKLSISRRVLESEDLLINAKIMDEFLDGFEDSDMMCFLESEFK